MPPLPVHDYFDVIGLPETAGPLDARRVAARYVRRCHPDFRGVFGSGRPVPPSNADVAINFIEPGSFLERIQDAFFAGPSAH